MSGEPFRLAAFPLVNIFDNFFEKWLTKDKMYNIINTENFISKNAVPRDYLLYFTTNKLFRGSAECVGNS